MGQAKRRGSFEDRKRQAIKDGRIKRRKKSKRQIQDEAFSKLIKQLSPLPKDKIIYGYPNIEKLSDYLKD
jgi:hypothetical protein